MSNAAYSAFELGANAFESVIIVDTVSKYLGTKYYGIKRWIGFIIAILTIFSETTLMNIITEFESIAVFIPIILVFIYSTIYLNGRIIYKLFLSISIIIIIILINSLVGFLISTCTGINMQILMSREDNNRITGVLITKIIFFYTTRAVLKFNNTNQRQFNKSEWLFMIIHPLISIVMLGALILVSINNNFDEIDQEYIMLVVIGVFIINLTTYFLFVKIGKENQLQLELLFLQQQYQNQKKNNQQIKNTYIQIRGIKHDMNNNLYCIIALLDKKKYEKVYEYCQKLIKQIDQTTRMIKTGNDIVDAILNAKLIVSQQENINMKLNISYNVNGIDDLDICILLGNLLDNAIDASKLVQMEKRYIELNIAKKKGYLSIICKNSIKHSILENNPHLLTNKFNAHEHGFGHINIKNVVEKYNGMIEYYEEQNLFCCSILLRVYYLSP